VVVPVISRAVPPAAKLIWTAHCAGHNSEPCRYLPLICRPKWSAAALLCGNFLRRGRSAGRRPGGRAPSWWSAGSTVERHFRAATVDTYDRQLSGLGQFQRLDGKAERQTVRQCLPKYARHSCGLVPYSAALALRCPAARPAIVIAGCQPLSAHNDAYGRQQQRQWHK
jgi:hypothetical protein